MNLMGKVVHVRDVPDEVHDKLTGVAEDQDLSLTAIMRWEMEHTARRAEAAQRNTEILKAARKKIGSRVPTDAIVAAVHDARECGSSIATPPSSYWSVTVRSANSTTRGGSPHTTDSEADGP
jgi:hypothetical protein